MREQWVRPPVVAREPGRTWPARWRFRLVALLLLALLVAGGVQAYRVLSGATAQDPGIGAAGRASGQVLPLPAQDLRR